MEFLTMVLNKITTEGRVVGIKLEPIAPTLIHVLYADDLVIFAQARVDEIQELKGIIQEFGDALGLTINPTKSRIWFGNKCTQNCKQLVLDRMQATSAREEDKYLGIMVQQKRGTTATHICC
jgi:Reverse transcriptase (RNA-dependent DNA polymerase)